MNEFERLVPFKVKTTELSEVFLRNIRQMDITEAVFSKRKVTRRVDFWLDLQKRMEGKEYTAVGENDHKLFLIRDGEMPAWYPTEFCIVIEKNH
jgi:hypothetical protein